MGEANDVRLGDWATTRGDVAAKLDVDIERGRASAGSSTFKGVGFFLHSTPGKVFLVSADLPMETLTCGLNSTAVASKEKFAFAELEFVAASAMPIASSSPWSSVEVSSDPITSKVPSFPTT